MIQPRHEPDRPESAPRHATPRRVRRPGDAARLRQARARRRRYRGPAQICAALCGLLILVMAYLGLMGNLTALSDRIARAAAERSVLQEQSLRLDDQIARLKSRERLAQIATKLKLQQPSVYAVVTVPPGPDDSADGWARAPGVPQIVAAFGVVAGWLKGL